MKFVAPIHFEELRKDNNITNLFSSISRDERLNDIRYLNKFLEEVNLSLEFGGIFSCKVETLSTRKSNILNRFRYPFNKIFLFLDTLVYRVMPKIWITKKFYFLITRGKGRVLSKAEIFGRLYSCGFKVVNETCVNGMLHFSAMKIAMPSYPKTPTYGPIIKLERIGKNGKLIQVWKFRTMHPFSEFLQEYVYEKNNLKKGGKIKNDFRITPEGKFLRKFWIDEIPMLYNVLTGDLKLVGVRPVSRHFFSLYSDELKDLRKKSKPGLIPPYYADLPESLEDIIASEIKYLKLYLENPLKTDLIYLYKILVNIIIKRNRSS